MDSNTAQHSEDWFGHVPSSIARYSAVSVLASQVTFVMDLHEGCLPDLLYQMGFLQAVLTSFQFLG